MTPCTCGFLWQTDCLQLSKCTKNIFLKERGNHNIKQVTSRSHLNVLQMCDQFRGGYQKSSRSSLTVAWNGMLRTRILEPVCFLSVCFFLRETSGFLQKYLNSFPKIVHFSEVPPSPPSLNIKAHLTWLLSQKSSALTGDRPQSSAGEGFGQTTHIS